MASADLSRRVEKVVGYPPLVDMDDRLRREFHEALLDADSFEDLRELHRLALREAVAVGQPGWGGGSTASQGGEAATAVSERSPSIGPTAGLEANARSARRDTEAGGTRRGHTCCPGACCTAAPAAARCCRSRSRGAAAPTRSAGTGCGAGSLYPIRVREPDVKCQKRSHVVRTRDDFRCSTGANVQATGSEAGW
jgi:hypothetical protein